MGRRSLLSFLLTVAWQIVLQNSDVALALSFNIAAAQDAEERDGITDQDSNDLELGDSNLGNQFVCMRFLNIPIEKGAKVNAARIDFTAKNEGGNNSPDPQFRLKAERSPFPAPYQNIDSPDLSQRTFTNAQLIYTESTNWITGNTFGTPNFSNVLTEVVNLNNWEPGRAMSICMAKTQNDGVITFRRALSIEGGSAPRLVVDFDALEDQDQPTAAPTTSPQEKGEEDEENLVADGENNLDITAVLAGAGGVGVIFVVGFFKIRRKRLASRNRRGQTDTSPGPFPGPGPQTQISPDAGQPGFDGGTGNSFGVESNLFAPKPKGFSALFFSSPSKYFPAAPRLMAPSQIYRGGKGGKNGGRDGGGQRGGRDKRHKKPKREEKQVIVKPGPEAHLVRTGKTGRGGFGAPFGAPTAANGIV